MWTYIQFEREFYDLQTWFPTFFSYFESLKSYGGLYIITKVQNVKILSNF